MNNDLQGKVALVTGGSGGIGSATVKKFLAAGAKVLLVDRLQKDVDEAVRKLDSPQVRGFAADVSNGAQVQSAMQAAVEAFGGLDVVFANAGIEGMVKPIVDYPEAEFDRVLAVNVRGTFLTIKSAVPFLQRRGGGSIIVTASIAGVIGSPGISAYVSSKHAVLGLVKVAALELGPLNIRVNAIAPGPIDNRMMRSIESQSGQAEATKAAFTAQIPMGRYGQNEEIAEMALFLGSSRSSYSSGGVFLSDGGFVAH
jgi:NAD(P)-dependent dehydrogenase (short-subunit alcohol dehydrogenase family)